MGILRFETVDVDFDSFLDLWSEFERPRSIAKHLNQQVDYLCSGVVVNAAKFFEQPLFVHGSNLIQRNFTLFALKSDGDPGGVVPQLRGHRRNYDGVEGRVHLVGRHHYTGSRLLNF